MGLTVQVSGAEFDAKDVPDGALHLVIYQIRKADLPRLAGLRRANIRSLELRWVSAPDLTAIPLPETLETLMIWQNPKLKSLDGLEQAQGLRALTWQDNGPLEDAGALASLPDLKVLRFEGGMNKRQKLASLDVLGRLALEELVLDGIAPHDLDVAPILALDGLKRISILGSDLDIASMARLAARFPVLHDALQNPEPCHSSLGITCAACGCDKVMLRLRRRKFLWCPDCEAERLATTLAQFGAMVEAARQDGIETLSGVELAQE